jgi:hypothetical protein
MAGRRRKISYSPPLAGNSAISISSFQRSADEVIDAIDADLGGERQLNVVEPPQ